jgi:hypothetical protein
MLETLSGSFLVPIWRRSHASLENWRFVGSSQRVLFIVPGFGKCRRMGNILSVMDQLLEVDVPRTVCPYTPIVLRVYILSECFQNPYGSFVPRYLTSKEISTPAE